MAWMLAAGVAAGLVYMFMKATCVQPDDDLSMPTTPVRTPSPEPSSPEKERVIELPARLAAKILPGTIFREGNHVGRVFHRVCFTCDDTAPAEALLREALHKAGALPRLIIMARSGVEETSALADVELSHLASVLALPWIKSVHNTGSLD